MGTEAHAATSSALASARGTDQCLGLERAANGEPVEPSLPLPPALVAAKGHGRWGLDARKVELRPGEPMVRVGFLFYAIGVFYLGGGGVVFGLIFWRVRFAGVVFCGCRLLCDYYYHSGGLQLATPAE